MKNVYYITLITLFISGMTHTASPDNKPQARAISYLKFITQDAVLNPGEYLDLGPTSGDFIETNYDAFCKSMKRLAVDLFAKKTVGYQQAQYPIRLITEMNKQLNDEQREKRFLYDDPATRGISDVNLADILQELQAIRNPIAMNVPPAKDPSFFNRHRRKIMIGGGAAALTGILYYTSKDRFNPQAFWPSVGAVALPAMKCVAHKIGRMLGKKMAKQS